MSNVKVYRIGDYEWWGTKWSMKETYNYYLEEYGISENDITIEDIIECDLDEAGMWYPTKDKEDIEKLGDKQELVQYRVIKGRKIRNPNFGDLMRIDNDVYKFITFREAIEKHGDFEKPFCIASIDW